MIDKVVSNRLTLYLVNKSLLSEFQFGFRRGSDKDSALDFVKNCMVDNMNSNRITCIISLDIQSAFNSVHMDDFKRPMNDYDIPDRIKFLLFLFIRQKSYYG